MTGLAAYRIDGRAAPREAFYAAACDPAGSVVVEACAGAGKTWMLVSRILRALLDGAQPHEIQAITFTRKAAGEMRARLQEWVSAFSTPHASHEQRVAELQSRGLAPQRAQALAPALARLHEQLLDAGRPVEIRTFHSWFSQLLRAAPMELLSTLGLHAAVELVEDETELRPDVFRRFHAALVADASLRADYAALVRARGRTFTRKWLESALDKRVEIQLADATGTLEHSVEPAFLWCAEFAEAADPACALKAPERTQLLLRVAASLGAQPGAVPRKQGSLLEEALAFEDARVALAAAREALFTKDGSLRKKLDVPGLQEAAQALDLVQQGVEQQQAHEEHARMVRLSRVLFAEYAAYKRSRGLADMADLERIALALLRDSALSGWVQERLDTRIRHLLIDEFQDTSPLQWHALHAWLSSYAGAGGGASGQQPPSVFIVGDPKQSIYRFRRAEPRVFAAAREFVVQGLGGQVLECDHTRRNAPEVIEKVNAVFNAATHAGGYAGFRTHTTEVPADVGKDHSSVLALPAIERPAAAARRDKDESPVWRDSLTTPRIELEEALRQQEARAVASEIAKLVTAGLAPGDVMVLARSRTSLRCLALELQALHLPYAASEAQPLTNSPQVRDLLALLDVLASTGHDLSLAHALKSPVFSASDEDLMQLSRDARTQGQVWWDALMANTRPLLQSPALQRARALLTRWSQAAAQLPPHDLLDLIVAEGQVRERVVAVVPDAQRHDALQAIDALLAQSLMLDGGRYATPYNFVRALKRRPLRAPAAAPADAVQLLTVHGAKGLEARAVFVMDCSPEARNPDGATVLIDWPVEATAPERCSFIASESYCPPSLTALLDSEREERAREELNALYVAMTRARERLVFSRTAPHRASASAWWPLLEMHVGVMNGPGLAETAALPAHSAVTSLVELPQWAAGVSSKVPMLSSRIEAAEDEAAARLGQSVHRILEWASASGGSASPGSAELPHLTLLALAAVRQAGLDDGRAPLAAQLAHTILTSVDCRPFFDTKRLCWAGNEVALTLHGDLLRIDRLVERAPGGDWWVLDYKLNHTPQALSAYLDQMRRYRSAVSVALGLPAGRSVPSTTVRCAFITGAGRVIEPDLGD